MGFTFRPGVRENVGLLIGLVGSSGSGKTFSAMRLASGISGGKPFAVIDTEARRALHYADRFKFDHGELRAPFRPDAYAEAIKAADAAGYPVIVVDNMSHEHYGEGGLLEWHDEQLDEFVKRAMSRSQGQAEWQLREVHGQRAWIEPKMSHKRMVQRLLQVRAHLILCFRAEEKTKIAKDKRGKTQITNAGWQPITEKNLPYELTCSLLMTDEKPGHPTPMKLQEQHKHLFPSSEAISEESGRLIAEWASGGTPAGIAEVIASIGACSSLEELKAIGAELASKKLSGADASAARDAYKQRQASFSVETEQPQEQHPDDPSHPDGPWQGPDGPVLCAVMDCGNPAEGVGIHCQDHKS